MGGQKFSSATTKERLMNLTAKALGLVILAAIVTALVVTLLQSLILGHASAAITGGVVGAVTAVMALSVMRNKSS
jgi:hypothetical protein